MGKIILRRRAVSAVTTLVLALCMTGCPPYWWYFPDTWPVPSWPYNSLDTLWPMDVGNKWGYVYYVDHGKGGAPVKYGLSMEVTEAGKDEEGRKYWIVSNEFLDADGNVTGSMFTRYFNKCGYRWLSFDPLFKPQRVLPRWFRVANSGLQTYCLERDHGECVAPVFTAVGYVHSLATEEWIEARNAEFGFDVTKVYGRQWLLGALEYDDSMLSAPGEPVCILKVHVGAVVMGGNQLLQYVKLKNKERRFFEY